MVNQWKLGIIGMSPGNGHAYSWSAICNGYNPEEMQHCPFPAIPKYLAEQTWPEAKIQHAQVTSIWCYEAEDSYNVAKASKIERVCGKLDQLLDSSDAILLARDDVVERRSILEHILAAGKPVFVDKPFALTEVEADSLFGMQKFDSQIYTTSALRYASEMLLSDTEKAHLGSLISVIASTPKYWQTYAVHLLEPIISQWCEFEPKFIRAFTQQQQVGVEFSLAQIQFSVQALGDVTSPIQLQYIGEKGHIQKKFSHAFPCFKTSIKMALSQWETNKLSIPRIETLRIARILGWVNHAEY
jgi:hypothetical protein